MRSLKVWSLIAAAGLVGSAAATVLTVEVGSSRSPSSTDDAVRQFAKNVAILTRAERFHRAATPLFSLPVNVVLTRSGRAVPPPATRGGGQPITLQFNPAAGRTFDPKYQAFLQSVFNTVQPRLDATFGSPSVGGTVVVSNYDADIGERDAVAGGYFFYDGSQNLQEIRFPVYSDSVDFKYETAAVNFVHTLLLAYLGPKMLPNDAWQEGLTRAAVMQIVRTPGSLPASLDSNLLEQILESTYDTSPTYDWNNQSALAGPTFIAPNLRSQALPAGGSVGGLYLVRYLMSGTAFQKVLLEYPAFASTFLNTYEANTSVYQSGASLVGLAQQTLDSLNGGPGATVEGLDFATWARRQRILDSNLSAGSKLLLQPFPITSNLSGTDFGVFGIQAHWFRTSRDGTETLLRDTANPILWSPSFTRFFTAAQDDQITISNGYGSIAPNFPSTPFAGQPYRVAVDVPLQGEIARIYLPAGAIATATSATVNNFYGSLTGLQAGATYSLHLSWANGGAVADVPVTNGAFGANITTGSFAGSIRKLKIDVQKTVGGSTSTALTRFVNKGPGSVGLDLHIDGIGLITVNSGLTKGLSLMGFIGQPYVHRLPERLGASVLASRYDPAQSRYVFYPEFGVPTQGQSVFMHADNASSLTYDTLAPARTPLAAHAKPGWNLICNPTNEAVTAASIQVVTGTDFAKSFADAAAAGVVGPNLFTLTPGANDAITGAPETGTLNANSSLDPGQAAFVKVYSSGGATLLFPTSDFRSRDGGGTNVNWLVQVEATGGGEKSSASFGSSKNASRGIDRGLDSELPPGQGALQLSFADKMRLYRDIRGAGKAETYNLNLENLKLGMVYNLKLKTTTSVKNRMSVQVAGKIYRVDDQGEWSFTARQKTMQVRIAVAKVSG